MAQLGSLDVESRVGSGSASTGAFGALASGGAQATRRRQLRVAGLGAIVVLVLVAIVRLMSGESPVRAVPDQGLIVTDFGPPPAGALANLFPSPLPTGPAQDDPATAPATPPGATPNPDDDDTRAPPHDSPVSPLVHSVTVLEERPHDPACFSQGLTIIPSASGDRELVLESCGLRGSSRVLRWDLSTGEVLAETPNRPTEFGEGVAEVPTGGDGPSGSRVVQLLWQTAAAVEYDGGNDGLALTRRGGATAAPSGRTGMVDGWGLSHSWADIDGSLAALGTLAGTDGGSTLYLLEPDTLRVRSSVRVVDGGIAIKNLNEVEWVRVDAATGAPVRGPVNASSADVNADNGAPSTTRWEVWANVWLTDCVVRIDPVSGAVHGWLVMADLRARAGQVPRARGVDRPDVLNGVAVQPSTGDVWVTGKQWPRIYRVEVGEGRDDASALASARRTCVKA